MSGTDPHDSHGKKNAVAEPRTPMWLPALGAFMFVLVGVWWAVTPSWTSSSGPTNGNPAADAAPSSP